MCGQAHPCSFEADMLDLATLAALHEKYREAAALPVADFALGPHRFDFSPQPYLMGVVNLSADSWYRESVALTPKRPSSAGACCTSRARRSSTSARNRRWPTRRRLDEQAQQERAASGGARTGRARASASRWRPIMPSVTTACLKAGRAGAQSHGHGEERGDFPARWPSSTRA